ncbi:MAG: hypothetical protein MUC54_03425 [Chloroflexi bacterium]|jgi:hypothetical protein|nr:hypothetical protein [Chloroflexota bacterium]
MTPQIAFDPRVAAEGYRPGACNIGPAEIAARRRTGYAGLAGAVGLLGILLIAGAPPAARWLVAAPLAAAALGFLQARLRFCVAYGLTGRRSLRALGQAERVTDAAARRADRRQAARLALAAIAAGLLGAALLVALPL